jgi:hypothetical protein
MKMSRTFIAIALLFSVIELFPGCASEQSTTVRSTTTSTNPAQPQDATTSASTPAQPQTTTTTTTEVSKPKEPDSVLGATAHALATVILFPFRLIGDAVGLIV